MPFEVCFETVETLVDQLRQLVKIRLAQDPAAFTFR